MSDTPETLKSNLLEMLEETFQTPRGIYLDRAKGGLFTTLEALSAETVSLETGSRRSIAAHVEHTRFYIDVLRRSLHSEIPKVNWDESWQTHAVTALEWQALQAALKREYEALMQDLRALSEDDIRLSEGLAVLTHSAYHFGAIRQLLL